MPAKPLRLSAPDFARLIQRHGLDEAGVREQGIIIPKAFAADVVCASDDAGEKRTSEWIMSTATPDRREDTIQVAGWKTANFKKGGSILFAHDGRSLPIGRPLKVWKNGKESLNLLMLHAGLDENHEVAETVWLLVKGKFLRGSSVGFIPLKWEFINEEEPWNGGINFLSQELVEHSLVPVPQNPEALLQAIGKGLDVDLRLFTGWQQLALDGEVPSLGAHHDDIAASLKALTGNPVSVSVPAADAVNEAAANMRRHSIGLANSVGELEAGLGIGKPNPFLSDEQRKAFEQPAAKSESAGGTASGVAASSTAAPSVDTKADEPEPIDTLTLDQAVAVARSLGATGDDAEVRASIDATLKALAEPAPTEEGEPMLTGKQITDHITELLKSAQGGDTDALEQIRTLAEQVNCAAKALAEADPDDVSFFEFTDDDETRDADEDLIEISGADLQTEIAKAVAKAVAQKMAAHTGQN